MSMHIRKEEIMKLRKKSGLISAIIALSCASLVSVGFASWVISQGDAKTVDGSIVVDTVETKQHTITVSPTTGTQICFTRPETPESTTYSWLSETTTTYENLVATFNVSVANVDGTAAAAKAKFSATLKSGTVSGENFDEDASNAGYLGAAAATYVGTLPTPVVADGSVADGTWSTTVTVTFTWGAYFGNQNPYYFYNAHKANDIKTGSTTYAADANTALTALNTFLSGISYRLSLSFAD